MLCVGRLIKDGWIKHVYRDEGGGRFSHYDQPYGGGGGGGGMHGGGPPPHGGAGWGGPGDMPPPQQHHFGNNQGQRGLETSHIM